MEQEKQKILIVDDSEMNRDILIDMLEDAYDTVEAEDGAQAIEILKERADEFSLILLDIIMPNVNGFEVLNFMRESGLIENIAVIMISSDISNENIEHAYALGAFDYIARPFDTITVQKRIFNTMLVYAKTRNLEKMLLKRINQHEKDNKLMISMLAQIMEFRNGESKMHILNTNKITKMLLERLIQKTDRYGIDYGDIDLISTASSLHDIGKNTIPEEILNKPGRLTNEEFAVMKTHAQAGADMLDKLPEHQRNNPILKVSHDVCRWHHERYDGRGYPDGLKGDEIPISAQAVGIADVYDALTSERCYKKAFSHEKAIQMIINNECGFFNPLLLECLLDISDALQRELKAPAAQESESRSEADVVIDTVNVRQRESEDNLMGPQVCRFLAENSTDIVFFYKEQPSTLTLNEAGKKAWGISAYTMAPEKNDHLKHLFGEDQIKEVKEQMKAATPSKPNFQMEVHTLGKDYTINAQVVFSNGIRKRRIGMVGECVAKEDSKQEVI